MLKRAPPSGKLLGCLADTDQDVALFAGIPYARPPVGELRWKPAEPLPPWSGTRLATAFGPACPQMPMDEDSVLGHPFRHSSEDCLYLNIWSTAKPEAKRPVMVWIHGGGLAAGAGCYPEYQGTGLAKKDAVVVTFNYRLGIFGYFSHPELRAESEHDASGNYGLSDQIQALRWIRDNIAVFGGDPENVTIFGESSGGWAVSQLMAAPAAHGLFHRAIGQSGCNLFQMRGASHSEFDEVPAEALGLDFGKVAGCQSLAELRNLPADILLDSSLSVGWSSEAVVDGWLLPDQILTIFETGRQANVPLLAGFNRDEAAPICLIGAIATASNEKDYIAEVRRQYGPFADQFLMHYPSSDIEASTHAVFRDAKQSTWGTISWVKLMSTVGATAYLYYFTYDAPSVPADLGAYHMAEIPYVLDNLDAWPEYCYPVLKASRNNVDDQRLADAMSDYWLAFARAGSPDVEGMPVWEPYTQDIPSYMEFAPEPRPGRDLMSEIWDFHERVNADRRANRIFAPAVYSALEGGFQL